MTTHIQEEATWGTEADRAAERRLLTAKNDFRHYVRRITMSLMKSATDFDLLSWGQDRDHLKQELIGIRRLSCGLINQTNGQELQPSESQTLEVLGILNEVLMAVYSLKERKNLLTLEADLRVATNICVKVLDLEIWMREKVSGR